MRITHLKWIGVLALLALWFPQSFQAQQEPSEDPQQQGESSSSSNQLQDDPAKEEKAPGIVLPSTPPAGGSVHQLGSAKVLPNERGMLRWGQLYVQSFEYQQMVADLNDSNGQQSRNVLASTFRANFIYDKPLRLGRLAFQYQPHLFIVDGKVLRDFANQSAIFEWSQTLSARWSVGITDQFTFYRGRNRFGGPFLSSDVLTGETLQNPFLDLTTNLISNRTTVGFNRLISNRTWLAFGPSVSFSQAFGGPERLSIRNQIYGIGVTLNHALSATKVVQLSYSGEISRFASNFDNRVFQSFGAGYSQLFGRSLRLHFGLGASTATPHGNPTRRDWTPTASVGMIKSFRTSILTATYQRSHNISGGFMTNRFTDRLDVGYSLQLTRKWRAALGYGSLREDSSGPNISGKYLTGEVSYSLSRHVLWFLSPSYKWQRGDQFQISTGNRKMFVTGLRWEARPGTAY